MMGLYEESKEKIQLTHILFVLTLIIGTFYFKEKNNIYFVIINILLYFITNIVYNDCLFKIANNNFKFKIESLWSFVNWDIVFFFLILISYSRVSKIS